MPQDEDDRLNSYSFTIMQFPVDLTVNELSNDSIEYLRSIEASRYTSREAADIIESRIDVLRRKVPPSPPRDETREPMKRQVVVIHHDGRTLPTMYGVPYVPHESTIADLSSGLEALVDLEEGERFIWGWTSFESHYHGILHGGFLSDTVNVPIDNAHFYTLTAWRVPTAPLYCMYEVSLGTGIGPMAPPILVETHDVNLLVKALRPFIRNEHLMHTIMVDAVAFPSTLRHTSWKKVVVILDDHVHAHGVPVYTEVAKPYLTHPSGTTRALLDTWRQEGHKKHDTLVREDSTPAALRSSLLLAHNASYTYSFACIDRTTIRMMVHVTPGGKHSTLANFCDMENRRRWTTAVHIEQRLGRSFNIYMAMLALLEMDDLGPSVEQPESIRIPLKRHQLQSIHKMLALEKTETFSSCLSSKCSDTTWWVPRFNYIYPNSPDVERSGGFLCDTVGMGKTLSMISMCVEHPPPTAGSFNTLIICPPSILVQWKREIEKYSSLKVLEYHGKKKHGIDRHALREYDIVLTTYTTYGLSPVLLSEGNPIRWHRVVYDESHTMSDSMSRRAPRARNVWCVSATPFTNIDRQLRAILGPLRFSANSPAAVYYVMEKLMVRHTQRQSENLPELIVHDVGVQFQTDTEKRLYAQVYGYAVNYMRYENGRRNPLQVHAYIQDLRQICTSGGSSGDHHQSGITTTPDYALVAPDDEDDMCPICMNVYDQPVITTCNHWFCSDCLGTALSIPPGKCPMCRAPQQLTDIRLGVLAGQVPPPDTSMEEEEVPPECSSKIQRLLIMLEAMRSTDPSAKALVFCESSAALPLITAALKNHGIKSRCIHGSMPAIQRGNAIKAFQEDAATTVFVSSIRSAGSGINLTAANHIFFVGPVINRGNYTQAVGRAHRTGQTRAVNVYRLYMEETIEERMIENLQWTYDDICNLFL